MDMHNRTNIFNMASRPLIIYRVGIVSSCVAVAVGMSLLELIWCFCKVPDGHPGDRSPALGAGTGTHRQHGQRWGRCCSSASTNLLTTLGGKITKGEKTKVPASHGLCSEIFSSGVGLEIDICLPGSRLFSER